VDMFKTLAKKEFEYSDKGFIDFEAKVKKAQ
jgi:hypothetical protein